MGGRGLGGEFEEGNLERPPCEAHVRAKPGGRSVLECRVRGQLGGSEAGAFWEVQGGGR